MTIKRVGLVVLVGIVLMVLAGMVGLWWSLPKFQVENHSVVKNFRLSTVWGNVFLWKMGYWPKVNGIKVIYTDDPQSGFRLNGYDGMETMSSYVDIKNKLVVISLRYNQDKLNELESLGYWFDRDVYAHVCLALEYKTSNLDSCYQKAMDYVNWAKGKHLPGVIKGRGLLGFQLVSQAYAQACWGDIPCGQVINGTWCVGGLRNLRSCANNSDCPGGTCHSAGEYCNPDLNVMSCGVINNQTQCNSYLVRDACGPSQCNTSIQSGDNLCSWDPGGGTLPPGSEPPPPPGSCTPNGVAPAGLNCARVGLYGVKTEQGRTTEEKYTCGPNATQPASTCNWWNGDWTGYFVAPVEGWYQFLIKAYPTGGMAIDLDGDGVMPNKNQTNLRGEGLLAVDQSCSDRYRPLWLRTFWNSTDPYPASGPDGATCTTPRDCTGSPDPECDTKPLCGTGAHCENVDYNYVGAVNPAVKTLLPVPNTGLTPIYPWTPTHSTPAYASTTDNEVILDAAPNYSISPIDADGGWVSVYAQRYLTAGAHKVHFWYGYQHKPNGNTTHYFDFYYRPPNGSNFIRTIELTGLDTCPFRPCDICTPAAPAAPTITAPVAEYRMRGTITQSVSIAHDGNWGTACPTPTNQIQLCVGTDEALVNNFTTCDVLSEMIAGAAGASSYTRTVTVGDDGRRIYVAARATNGGATSTAATLGFYEPADLTVNVREGADCASDIGAITGWTATETSLLGSQSNATGIFNLLPSHIQTMIQVSPPADWVQTCAQPASTQLNTDVTAQFRFARAARAWFKVDYGDVGARGGNIVNVIPANQLFFGPDSLASGLSISNGSLDLTGEGKLGPDTRMWAAEGTGLAGPPTNGWYGYFDRTFDQLINPRVITPLQNAAFNDVSPTGIWTQHIDETSSYVVYTGNLTVDGVIDVPANQKFTIFVNGNLTVNSPTIAVPLGSFLGFVVSGDIAISADTESLDGAYIADGSLTIASNTIPFVGNGTFAGMTGVELQRDLDPDGTTLENNTKPAELFNYRPDLLNNAPIGFKRIPLQWQEVEPTGTDVTSGTVDTGGSLDTGGGGTSKDIVDTKTIW